MLAKEWKTSLRKSDTKDVNLYNYKILKVTRGFSVNWIEVLSFHFKWLITDYTTLKIKRYNPILKHSFYYHALETEPFRSLIKYKCLFSK